MITYRVLSIFAHELLVQRKSSLQLRVAIHSSTGTTTNTFSLTWKCLDTDLDWALCQLLAELIRDLKRDPP